MSDGSVKPVNEAPASAAPAAAISATQVASAASGKLGLVISPQILDFGNTAIGVTSSLEITINNFGFGDVTLSQQLMADGPGFSSEGIGSGLTLNPSQSTTLQVNFRPNSDGIVTGSISVSSKALDSPVVIPLTGTGVARAHSVTLTWDPDPDVVGYHVYRRTSDGDKMKKLPGPPVQGSSYTDLTVEGGQTYFYSVSAIGSEESEPSLEVTAVIPSP